MMTIAERIKHIRTHHNLTQREVAEMANVSTPAVS
ncbi:MAG: helix-turn-helix transcriptional regulator, partial [Methylococcales bacterium]|nr:helix-turn-helix transcriptional regulator [Methylococcales bacterium]